MFTGTNWEITYRLKKVNGEVQKALPEYSWDIEPARVIQILRKRCEEIADKGSFVEVDGQATQIDRLDKSSGKVYYSTPTEIYTFKYEQS